MKWTMKWIVFFIQIESKFMYITRNRFYFTCHTRTHTLNAPPIHIRITAFYFQVRLMLILPKRFRKMQQQKKLMKLDGSPWKSLELFFEINPILINYDFWDRYWKLLSIYRPKCLVFIQFDLQFTLIAEIKDVSPLSVNTIK